jgi:two-component system, LytTR family, sensor kinase
VLLGTLARSPLLETPSGGRLFPRIPGPPPDLPTLLFLLGVGSVTWYILIIALPALLWLARRTVGENHSRWRVLMLAAAAVTVLFGVAAVAQYAMTYRGAPSTPSFRAYLPIALRQQFLPFVALVGIVAAVETRRRGRESALERERLRALIAEQRLVTLTAQLQPHFLFNTLQGISTLLHRDPEAADEMLGRLSDLLRELLRHRERPVVRLADELRFATLFLEIARVRFADRLEFTLNIPPELEDASVPLFLLQPLVENALAHGIGRRAAGGRITIDAHREGSALLIDVRDDGAALPTLITEGIGITNTRERLRAVFGDDQAFSLTSAPDETIARTRVPYRPLA